MGLKINLVLMPRNVQNLQIGVSGVMFSDTLAMLNLYFQLACFASYLIVSVCWLSICICASRKLSNQEIIFGFATSVE